MIVLGSAFILVGTAISLLAAVGVLVFPTPLSRMHAATKAASLGLSAITIGAGLSGSSPSLVAVGIVVTVFLFLTSPVSGHLLGRATYLIRRNDALVHDDLRRSRPQPLRLERPPVRDFSIARWLSLVVVWVVLWRDPSPGTVVAGAAVGGLFEALRASVDQPSRVRILGLLRFVVIYVGLVIRSTAAVAREVILVRSDRLREAIVAVPLGTNAAAHILLVADAVSFTPGTLTLDVEEDPAVLYVHVLRFESVEATRADVAVIERLVASLFPERVDSSG